MSRYKSCSGMSGTRILYFSLLILCAACEKEQYPQAENGHTLSFKVCTSDSKALVGKDSGEKLVRKLTVSLYEQGCLMDSRAVGEGTDSVSFSLTEGHHYIVAAHTVYGAQDWLEDLRNTVISAADNPFAGSAFPMYGEAVVTVAGGDFSTREILIAPVVARVECGRICWRGSDGFNGNSISSMTLTEAGIWSGDLYCRLCGDASPTEALSTVWSGTGVTASPGTEKIVQSKDLNLTLNCGTTAQFNRKYYTFPAGPGNSGPFLYLKVHAIYNSGAAYDWYYRIYPGELLPNHTYIFKNIYIIGPGSDTPFSEMKVANASWDMREEYEDF